MDRTWLNLGPTLFFLGLMSAEGHLKLALAVPWSPWAGPYDPMGALYGRRGHGRLRCRPTVRPGDGKGLIVNCVNFRDFTLFTLVNCLSYTVNTS